MSPSCNGVKKNSRSSSKTALSLTLKKQRKLDTESFEYTNKKPGFKGFECKPVVLLPRFNIKPYIKTNESKKIQTNSLNNRADVLLKFTQRCYVKLARADFSLLTSNNTVLNFKNPSSRDILLETQNSSHNNNSELLNSDSDTETMGDMSLKCNICEKSYCSEKKLMKHQSNKHIIYKDSKPIKRVSFSDHVTVHEVHEYHKCRKCTRIFDNYKLLKQHMKQNHKKRNCYICNYCNRNFVDRMIFKLHIKLHCDVCSTYFRSKAKYLEHRRSTSCRVIKLHKCNTCASSFYSVMDLKDHSYDHTDVLYVCDICKDQFNTKCATAHHIAFLHSNKRPNSMYTMRNLGTERLYLCNFCDESSVDKDLIELHVQTLPDLTNKAMTGYKDYYFCDQCFKKFDTESDMLHHKWTHFLKPSDRAQVKPKGILINRIQSPAKSQLNTVPKNMTPKVVLERIPIEKTVLSPSVDLPVKRLAGKKPKAKTAIICPTSKKTVMSMHQCQTCGKYFANNHCLSRHIETQHSDYEKLQCNMCEERFAWPSLLKSHKCVRLKPQELDFDDNRPEIHFDNLHQISTNSLDEYNVHAVDFEIPEPIKQMADNLTHDTNFNGAIEMNNLAKNCLNNGYKLIIQEVPIEF